MQTLRLSPGERQFNCDLLSRNMRLDGREFLQQRKSIFETNPLPLSPSSCRVTWGHGYGNTTEVIVSVTTEIALNENAGFVLSVKALPGSFGADIEAEDVCQVIRNTLEHFINNSTALEPKQFILFNASLQSSRAEEPLHINLPSYSKSENSQ